MTTSSLRNLSSGVQDLLQKKETPTTTVPDENSFVRHSSCPLCQCQDIKVMDRFNYPEPYYSLYRCRCCGIIFLNPWLKNSESAYRADFFEAHLRPLLIQSGLIDKKNNIVFSKVESSYVPAFSLLKKYYTSDEIVDIGAGYGLLTALMRYHHFPAIALERNQILADIACDIFKINILPADIHTYQGKKFNLGVLNSVIEHVHSPVEFLQDLRRNLLLPESKIIVTVPNIFSLQTVFDRKYVNLFNGGHVWYFSEMTLCMLMERSGYKLIELLKFEPHTIETYYNLEVYLKEFLELDINCSGAIAGVWTPK